MCVRVCVHASVCMCVCVCVLNAPLLLYCNSYFVRICVHVTILYGTVYATVQEHGLAIMNKVPASTSCTT